MGVFQLLWVYYGLLIASRPVVAWNLLAILINFVSAGAFRHFARKEAVPHRSVNIREDEHRLIRAISRSHVQALIHHSRPQAVQAMGLLPLASSIAC